MGPNDEPLPPGVENASFGKLHEMIAHGIADAETSASKLEAEIREDADEVRRRAAEIRNRREQELEQKRQERQKQRLEQRRAEEIKQKRLLEQMQQQEEEEKRLKEQQKRDEQQCKVEFRAITKIQARFRGHRSRKKGKHTQPPFISGTVHNVPYKNSGAQKSPPSSAADPLLLS